jgi:hypothetical protein
MMDYIWKMKAQSLIAAALLICSAAPLWAHHSYAAEFDDKQPVHLDGVVAELDWTNPHVIIYVDVKGTRWMVEAGSPSALVRRGFTKNSASVGTHVVIDGYRSKDGHARANGRDILLPNGQKLILSLHGSGAP